MANIEEVIGTTIIGCGAQVQGAPWRRPGQAYTLIVEEVHASREVVTCTILVGLVLARVLVYSGALPYFILFAFIILHTILYIYLD